MGVVSGFLHRTTSITDPITGCTAGDTASLEACNQTYYLKQQNSILQKTQSQQASAANTQKNVKELQDQITTLQQDNAVLKAKSELFQQVEQGNTQLVVQLANQTAKNDLFLALIISLAMLMAVGWIMFILRIKHNH
ncbi:MAG: hypothetical protein WCT08_00145 [Patescibacteria group bacterium]|jgi:translation initiation factor 2B subunit (eIF-2B alpha/beta/delta family)